jgi:transcriptional regulator with XRE-family HTH domain
MASEISLTVAKRLRERRKQLGLRPRDMPGSDSELSRIEHGSRLPALGKFERLVEALRCSPAYFLEPDEYAPVVLLTDPWFQEAARLLKQVKPSERMEFLDWLKSVNEAFAKEREHAEMDGHCARPAGCHAAAAGGARAGV